MDITDDELICLLWLTFVEGGSWAATCSEPHPVYDDDPEATDRWLAGLKERLPDMLARVRAEAIGGQ